MKAYCELLCTQINETNTFDPGADEEIQFEDPGADDEDTDSV